MLADGGMGLRLFLSSVGFPGNLRAVLPGQPSGVVGADGLCQHLADARQLDGVWRAYVSTAGTRAADRIWGDGPWTSLDGGSLFGNRAALVLGLSAGRETTNERGLAAGGRFWTGTSATGSASAPSCMDWTSGTSVAQGQAGSISGSSYSWAQQVDSCDTNNRLLCVEQPFVLRDGGVVPSPRGADPKRLFVTSLALPAAGGMGLGEADRLCTQVAVARSLGGTWRALLSSPDGGPAADRPTSGGPFTTLDGGVVFVNREALRLAMTSGGEITNEQGGTQGTFFFWSGSTNYGGVGPLHCNGWEQATDGGRGAVGSINGPAIDWEEQPQPCDSALRLLCVEE